MSAGVTCSASAIATISIRFRSKRRSPVSILETKDCGLLSDAASSTCVRTDDPSQP